MILSFGNLFCIPFVLGCLFEWNFCQRINPIALEKLEEGIVMRTRDTRVNERLRERENEWYKNLKAQEE